MAAPPGGRLTVVITSVLPRYTRPTIDEFDRTGTWIVTPIWRRERHYCGSKPTTDLAGSTLVEFDASPVDTCPMCF
jgi:hypothetical protein